MLFHQEMFHFYHMFIQQNIVKFKQFYFVVEQIMKTISFDQN